MSDSLLCTPTEVGPALIISSSILSIAVVCLEPGSRFWVERIGASTDFQWRKGFLQMLEATSLPHKIKFTKYDQSSKCTTRRDSSVSYAAAVVLPAS